MITAERCAEPGRALRRACQHHPGGDVGLNLLVLATPARLASVSR